MTFIEAVKALKNGECEGIRRPMFIIPVKLPLGYLRWAGEDQYIPHEIDILADDWELVPKPVKVVEGWVNVIKRNPDTDSCFLTNTTPIIYKAKEAALKDRVPAPTTYAYLGEPLYIRHEYVE